MWVLVSIVLSGHTTRCIPPLLKVMSEKLPTTFVCTKLPKTVTEIFNSTKDLLRANTTLLWLVLLNLYWGNTDFPTADESNNKVPLLYRHYCNHIKFVNAVSTFTFTFSQTLPIKLSSKFIYCMLCSAKHNFYYLREQTQMPGN